MLHACGHRRAVRLEKGAGDSWHYQAGIYSATPTIQLAIDIAEARPCARLPKSVVDGLENASLVSRQYLLPVHHLSARNLLDTIRKQAQLCVHPQ